MSTGLELIGLVGVHARVTRITVAPGELTGEMLAFRAQVLSEAKGLPGYRGALDLVDRETGRAIAVTFWADEASLRASERARKAPSAPGGPAVETYEIALCDLLL
jgi:heme-degrading monooxygenase HmoA